jgi:hypothetical protein
MLKLIAPIAISLLTVISIAPKSEAIPINLNSISFEQSGKSAPRVIVNIGTQAQSNHRDYSNRTYSNRWETQRRYQLEQEAAARRRHRYYSQHDRNNRNSEYRNEDRSDYHYDH